MPRKALNVAHIRPGNAVSTGVGLGLGLAMSNYIYQALRPYEALTEVIVCLNCRKRNSIEDKYCWECGRPLYPMPTIQCSNCKANVPSMKYCGNCGAELRKA